MSLVLAPRHCSRACRMHRSLGFFALAVLLESCAHDAAGPGAGATVDPPSRMFVSNSRSAASATASIAASVSNRPAVHPNTASRTMALAEDEGNVAYISLQPQTNPGGVSAVISNQRSGVTISAPMLDGGMDPVPLPANTGDSVRIEIQNASGVTIETLNSSVASKRPPKIVRTSPGRGKTGVPLNKNIEIVFTEPVSSLSLSSSVQLFRGATQVAGTVEILQGVTATVVFKPSSLLDANADYELVVTPGVRDLDGDAVDSVTRVPFKTGTTTEGPLASLDLIPSDANVRVGDQFQLVVVAKDAAGTLLTGHPVKWSATDPTIVDVSSTGLVTARGEGTGFVDAEVDGYFVAIYVGVSNGLLSVASVTASMDSASVAPGSTLLVAAIARDAQGNLIRGRIAKWSSSNPTVARVTPSDAEQIPENDPSNAWLGAYFAPRIFSYPAEVGGLVNGVSRIIVSFDGKSDTIVVTVTSSATLAGLVLPSDTATLLLRETRQLLASSVNSAGGRVSIPASQIQWESSNPAIATVDANGFAAGIGAGSATITARWNNFTTTLRITVEEVAFQTISAGGTHACGLTTGGATYCWGANDFGQTGRPGVIGGPITFAAQTFRPVPIRAADGFTFVAITTGAFHTCGLTVAGAAYCWGLNHYGALGSGNFEDSWRPVAVTGGLAFTKIEAGSHQTCGLTSAGSAYCWGSTRLSPFDIVIPVSKASPAAVAGGISFATLSSGGSHTCGLTADGAAYCWGENAAGQLGVGESVTTSATPLPVNGGLTFASISAGESHTCAVARNGHLYCWGWNFDNQLGNGIPTALSSTPTAVASSLSFTITGAARAHTCAIDASSVTYCWGRNSAGQIGLGTITAELFATPQRVVGGIAFDRLSVGRSYTCAATAAGVWYCWGDNESGVLGIGNTTDSGTPLKVLGQP